MPFPPPQVQDTTGVKITLARSRRHFWRHLLVLSDRRICWMILPASSSLPPPLARSLPACPASFLPSPVCFLLTLYSERGSEGGEICPERNIMITPRVRRAHGGEGRRRRRRKKWFCKREGAAAAALVQMVHSLFEPRWRYWPRLERGKIGGWSEERSKWESVSRIAKLLLRVGTFVHGRRRDGWRRRGACGRARPRWVRVTDTAS